MQPQQPRSNVGTVAAVITGVAAVGGLVAAIAAGSGGSKKPRLGRAPYTPPKLTRKPCGCGR